MTTGAAGVEATGAEVTAAGVLDELDVVDVLNVADGDGVTDGGEEGVSAGQSAPASAGRSQGMISRKTGEHWAPRLSS